MIGILVTGPNASGKTTALQSAAGAYVPDTRLRVIYADNSDRKNFKGDVTQMTALLETYWLSQAEIVIVEGTRMPTIVERVYRANPTVRELYAYVTVMTGEVMEANLRRRCTLLKKRYRDDYWDIKKLTYEGSRRYRASVPRFVPEDHITWWNVDETYDQALAMRDHMAKFLSDRLKEPQGWAGYAPPVTGPVGLLF